MKVQSIYTSKIVKKGLKFAADNGTLFGASAALAFSALRPLIILATPKTDKENREYASTKSIASSLIGYFVMLGASLPVARAVKNIDKNPSKYLKSSTIAALQSGTRNLQNSSRYTFSTQLIKLGLGLVVAVPKSVLTCAMIPPIMSRLFNKKPETNKDKQIKNLSLTGIGENVSAKLSKYFGKMIDSQFVRNLAEKFHNTKFEQHIIALTDTLATGAFITQAFKSKKIDEEPKKALIYNSAISTGLSIAGMYSIDKLTEKPTQRFIENFKTANSNSKNLDKYVEGIRIAKPLLILGSIYYLLIPALSTFFADKIDKFFDKKH